MLFLIKKRLILKYKNELCNNRLKIKKDVKKMGLRLNLLDKQNIFNFEEIIFDKQVTYIYGKNGTGKSTIAEKLKEYNGDYDINVFQGFDNIISENHKLNGVVLGTSNVEIDNKVKEKEEELELKKEEINKQQSVVNLCDEKKENVENKLNCAKTKLSKELTKIAKNLRERDKTFPQYNEIFDGSYNKTKLEKDIDLRKSINENELKQFINVLNSDIREVPLIKFLDINYEKLIDEIKNILEDFVHEVSIERIGKDERKVEFARQGLNLHNEGDFCAFCGGKIKEEVTTELETFFKCSDVDQLQKRIENVISDVESNIELINAININIDDFSDMFKEKIKKLKNDFDDIKRENIDFLNFLRDKLNEKKKNLFKKINFDEKLILPTNISEIKEEFENVKKEIKKSNNKLKTLKEEALKKIRYHYVCEEINQSDYFELKGELISEEQNLENEKDEYNKENKKLKNLEADRQKIKDEIERLKKETASEETLVFNINKKLKSNVKFKLVHCKEENKGFYRIIENGNRRDVTELSTGEKNIVAFLYFIEKINELKEEVKPKLIVFDDPMNSNDDVMQYLIMEEISKLKKSMKKDSKDNKLIILTHNKHFYMNITYDENDKSCRRIRLQSNGIKTSKEIVSKNDDFKTSYDSLWNDLKFIYENEDSTPDLMLNTMRRIIETYTKFNGINQIEFLSSVPGARKLFNVNSHSIDDLEADLNGKSKDDILQIFSNCFEKNNAKVHFDKHFE